MYIIAGRDYDPGPYDVTFVASTTNATFSVELEPDNILEGDEIFFLRIASSSPRAAVTGGNMMATFIIIDNDRKYTHFFLYGSVINFDCLFVHCSYQCQLQSVTVCYY